MAVSVSAQNNNGGGQGGQGGQFPGGIAINPDGVISAGQAQAVNPAIQQRRLKAVAAAQLPKSMTQVSKLRYVSLAGLEKACQESVDAGTTIGPELRYLGGITQIQYLFALPETGDVVIAGPAEGFAPMPDGRVVGIETGRPTLTLDDLLVMLRLRSTAIQLGCSFDPDPGRLAKAQAWNKANNAPAVADVARQRFFQMAEILGHWNVTVFGFPASCHAAVTAVEADYQLKCIALGTNRPQIRGFVSHFDLARPGENTMRRWWFAPHYELIEQSPDGLAFQLAGPRLQLMTQEELVGGDGSRTDAAFKEVSTERYTKQFNKHIAALCQQIPSFAATQNLFDLAIVAALIRRNELLEKSGWTPTLFVNDKQLPLQQYSVPTKVASQVNVKAANRGLLIGVIGGGVTIVPDRLVTRTNTMAPDQIPKTNRPADQVQAWWWD